MNGEALEPFRLFVVTGEASGENLAASFIVALRARLAPRPLEIMGIGGPVLAAHGLVSRFPQSDIQLMGFVEVIRRLPTVLARIGETVAAVLAEKPDLLLTVDVPDFSMRVARKVRAQDPAIPIVHWVAPTVWAWRPGRARAMKPHVDHLLALLPFEPKVFGELGGPPTTYVGHPLLAEAPLLRPSPEEQRLRDNAVAPVVLVLPGSRRAELKHLMPTFRDAVRLAQARLPHARFVLPAVAHLADQIEREVAGWPVKPEVLRGPDAKRAAFRRARAALAASGTVTLELALAGIPLVGAYRGHAIEAMVARRLIRSHSVLMCNLVLGRNVAPEFLQEAATPAALADTLVRLIADSPERAEQVSSFATLDSIMVRPDGRGAADAAVDVALATILAKS
jgi:lipid-A-disaccharide synthase